MPHGPKPIVTRFLVKAADACVARTGVVGVRVVQIPPQPVLIWRAIGLAGICALCYAPCAAILQYQPPDGLTLLVAFAAILFGFGLHARVTRGWTVELLTWSGATSVYWSTDYDQCCAEANELAAILFPQ